ncbi:hypothetical protein [Pararhizobium polonicum]|uniref:hypothetical protein n=1 Tax=Pararhizobium polonicum TaxID=1612624 RepID=UPI00083A5CAF|nr:hypothetical protein [Pararhizobium polonicum]
MRPIIMPNATKVLIMAVALILPFADFAEARDRNGEGHFVRRHHERPQHDRPQHNRQEAISGISADHHHRRNRNVRLSGRSAERRHVERDYVRDRRPNRQIVVREYRRNDSNYWEPAYGGDGFPSKTRGGTYFGGLSAWTDPGNGIYFRSERDAYGYYPGNTDQDYRNPRPKIITVNPSTSGRACSWESGVCVIRR